MKAESRIHGWHGWTSNLTMPADGELATRLLDD